MPPLRLFILIATPDGFRLLAAAAIFRAATPAPLIHGRRAPPPAPLFAAFSSDAISLARLHADIISFDASFSPCHYAAPPLIADSSHYFQYITPLLY